MKVLLRRAALVHILHSFLCGIHISDEIGRRRASILHLPKSQLEPQFYNIDQLTFCILSTIYSLSPEF